MQRKILSLVLLIPSLTLANITNNQKSLNEFNLTIAHTGDVHSHLLPINKYEIDCNQEEENNNKCFGGIARMATAINQLRQNNNNFLLLDTGDQFQGTLFYSKYKGEEARYFLNKLRFDATTLGNHEFDDGLRVLSRYIKSLNLPVVSANIDASHEPLLAGFIKPFVIVNVNNQKIGIIGCTTLEAKLHNPGKNLKFNNIESSVAKNVEILQKLGINKIILISHQGYEEDKILASKINGIGLIIGGHSHTYLSNNNHNKNIDKAAGPYPTVIKSPNGQPVLIVHSYKYSKYLGNINITFDNNGIPIKWHGEPILLDAKFQQDPVIANKIQVMNKPLQKMRQKVIGKSNVDLNPSCGISECNFGNLVTDALLNATSIQKTQIAIINGGAIRSGIKAGEVTIGNILEASPFNNSNNNIIALDIKGKDLRTILENDLEQVANSPNGSGRFPQVSKLRIKWNPKLPLGQKIISIEVKQKDDTYLPLKEDSIYRIAIINFMLQVVDNHDILSRKTTNLYDSGILVSSAITKYIKQHSLITAKNENRIVEVN